MIGHSLGAHASGYAGNWIKENTYQVLGRITGLVSKLNLFDEYATIDINMIHQVEIDFG